MDLNARKLRILKTIIDEYILSASPVGSKFISSHPNIKLSSATIRNEMADLEDLGYLEQPHTSAGRIPSDKAYRLYVDNLMQRAQLNDNELAEISRYCKLKVNGLDSMLRETASVLSGITHYTALILMPEVSTNRLRHLQLVPLGEGYALVVVVTDAGVARDSVIKVPPGVDGEQLDFISRSITARYYNCRISDIGSRMIKELTPEFMGRGDFLEEVFASVRRSTETDSHRIALSGAKNMLEYPEYSDTRKARDLLEAVERKDAMYSLLKNNSVMEFTIRIGNELGQDAFKDCSLVTATYSIGNMPVGSMGVIGPTRMNYAKVMTVMEYMRNQLGEILSNLLEEEKN